MPFVNIKIVKGQSAEAKKKNLPPLSCTKSEPRNEINGGEVKATTTSNRRNSTRRAVQLIRKLPKLTARRSFDSFPRAKEEMRIISMPFHVSRRGKRFAGSS